MESITSIEKFYIKVPILNDADETFETLYGRAQSLEETGVSQGKVDIDHIVGYYTDEVTYDSPVIVIITTGGDIYTSLNEEQYIARFDKITRVVYNIQTPLQ